MAFDGCRWYRLYMYLVLVGLLVQLESVSAGRCLIDRPGRNSSSSTVIAVILLLQYSLYYAVILGRLRSMKVLDQILTDLNKFCTVLSTYERTF